MHATYNYNTECTVSNNGVEMADIFSPVPLRPFRCFALHYCLNIHIMYLLSSPIWQLNMDFFRNG